MIPATIWRPRVETEATASAGGDDLLLADDRARFTARVDGRRKVAPGDPLELAVETANMHFFDPDSGAVLGAGEPVAA